MPGQQLALLWALSPHRTLGRGSHIFFVPIKSFPRLSLMDKGVKGLENSLHSVLWDYKSKEPVEPQ